MIFTIIIYLSGRKMILKKSYLTLINYTIVIFSLGVFFFSYFYLITNVLPYMVLSLRLLFWVVSRFPAFPSDPCFYANIPDFYTEIPCWYFSTCCTACAVCKWGEGGFTGWCGGVPSLAHVFTRACDLTCQPDSNFHIPVRITFPQGTG